MLSKTISSIAIVGAGFSGAVIARELAEAGFNITVFDERSHIAGNCYTERNLETNVNIHVYGPHIFHTNNKRIWDYANKFGKFIPFINRVKTIYGGQVYSLPINLMTINTFFGKCLGPSQAKEFIESVSDTSISSPANFEEQALRFVGKDLYEAFFKGYTQKQWGLSPTELPPSILKRLPIRFNYDDNYYNSSYQGIPKDGYTNVIANMLNHPNISLNLSTKFVRKQSTLYDHVFNSGSIDCWFSHSEGRLGYRTLDFIAENHEGDYQGNAVINYANADIPFTRISEHKHFAPWETHEKTTIYKEFSRFCGPNDIPYYPIRLLREKDMLQKYIYLAKQEAGVTFVGRLGTYRYLDMHICIEEALVAAELFLSNVNQGVAPPSFIQDVL